MSGAGRWAAGVSFPVVMLGAVALLLAGAAGADVGVPWLVLSGLFLVAGGVTAAGLAAFAFVRRQPWWGVLLLLAWPVVVPLYVRELWRRRSEEAEV